MNATIPELSLSFLSYLSLSILINVFQILLPFPVGLLYAVGGHDGSDHLHSGEMFDPKTNLWSPIAHMATLR